MKDNNNSFISKFLELWSNKRTHAAIVLGMYGLFFIILFILMSIGSNKSSVDQNKSNEKNHSDVVQKIADLNKNNYDVNCSDGKYVYIFNNYDNNYIIKDIYSLNNILYNYSSEKCISGIYDEKMNFIESDELCPEIEHKEKIRISNFSVSDNVEFDNEKTYSFTNENSNYKIIVNEEKQISSYSIENNNLNIKCDIKIVK